MFIRCLLPNYHYKNYFGRLNLRDSMKGQAGEGTGDGAYLSYLPDGRREKHLISQHLPALGDGRPPQFLPPAGPTALSPKRRSTPKLMAILELNH